MAGIIGLVLFALLMISLIALVRPLPRLGLPTRRKAGGLLFSSLLLFAVFGAIFGKEKEADPSHEGNAPKAVVAPPSAAPPPEYVEVEMLPPVEQETTTFPFTAPQFVDRYNLALRTVAQNVRVRLEPAAPDEAVLTMKSSSADLAATIMLDPTTQQITSMFLLLSGDGTIQSGADVFVRALAFVMAIEEPQMPQHQRGPILKDLGFLGQGDLTNETIMIRKQVQYRRTFSQEMGTMVQATPTQTVATPPPASESHGQAQITVQGYPVPTQKTWEGQRCFQRGAMVQLCPDPWVFHDGPKNEEHWYCEDHDYTCMVLIEEEGCGGCYGGTPRL